MLTVSIDVWNKTTNTLVSQTFIGGSNGANNTPQYTASYDDTGYGTTNLGRGTYYCKVKATITPAGVTGQPAPPSIYLTEVITADLTLN